MFNPKFFDDISAKLNINRQTVKDKLTAYKEVQIILEARNGKDFLEQLKVGYR